MDRRGLCRYEAIVAGNEATLMSAAFFDFVGHIATAAQDDPEEQERIIVTGNRIAAIHEAYAQAADNEAQLAEAQEKLQDVLKVRPPAALAPHRRRCHHVGAPVAGLCSPCGVRRDTRAHAAHVRAVPCVSGLQLTQARGQRARGDGGTDLSSSAAAAFSLRSA